MHLPPTSRMSGPVVITSLGNTHPAAEVLKMRMRDLRLGLFLCMTMMSPFPHSALVKRMNIRMMTIKTRRMMRRMRNSDDSDCGTVPDEDEEEVMMTM